MRKIRLIIWREYITRVRKKSFIVMTILGPVLMAAVMYFMVYAADADQTEHKVAIIDNSLIIKNNIEDTKKLKFYFPEISLEDAIKDLEKDKYTAVAVIESGALNNAVPQLKVYVKKAPGISLTEYLEKEVEKKLNDAKLYANRIDPKIIKNCEVNLETVVEDVTQGKETKGNATMAIGFVCGILIFFFVLFYGMQVMRGVMEEKTSRIVEVIISSVKPFQLMLGKIIGVALVGVTQFLLWVILSFVLSTFVTSTLLSKQIQDTDKLNEVKEQVFKQGSSVDMKEVKKDMYGKNKEVAKLINEFNKKDIIAILVCFFLYFIGGYLLYSAMFAAIGSAVDSETDSQQFMVVAMVPLMIAYFGAYATMVNPEGSIGKILSFVPFTSPIVMMVRMPQGVPMWEIAVSLLILIASFVGMVWLAARIYRTGILMYGKKVTWRELGKWLFYKA